MALAPMPARQATIASDPDAGVIGVARDRAERAEADRRQHDQPGPQPPARPGAGASRHSLPTS